MLQTNFKVTITKIVRPCWDKLDKNIVSWNSVNITLDNILDKKTKVYYSNNIACLSS